MKTFYSCALFLLVGVPLMMLGGCSLEVDHSERAGYYQRRDGFYRYRSEPRVIIERYPRRVYTYDRW